MYRITALLGVALGLAPFVLNYDQTPTALWTSLAIGAVLLVASGFEWLENGKDNLEYWIAGLVGLAAIAIPFLFGFSGVAVWTLVIVGAATVLAAGARLYMGGGTRYGT